jgi:hypothetical protein
MLNHFNKEKIFENHLTKKDLRELPVLFVLKFLTTIKVAEFGKAVLQIIQIKLINQI